LQEIGLDKEFPKSLIFRHAVCERPARLTSKTRERDNALLRHEEDPMQVPLEIIFRNSEHSETLRSEIEREAKRLEKFYRRITSCHVTVIAPQTRHRHGGLFEINIRVAMPEHKDILVNKTHGDVHEHEYVAVAIKDAFDAAQRQIEDAVREMRGQVKPHQVEDHGRVAKFLAGGDYGFIETADGRQIYFHRNSVLDGDFNRLTVGSEVRFVEEIGEKGPQASTVRPVAEHHQQ
jgi:cold shock CspA family protein